MKKVLAFDLDDTLAVTKSPISDRMAALLGRLLEYYDVCVITGGTFKQIRLQVIDRLSVSPQQLARFHAMPTCGTRYYRYDTLRNEWELQYAEDLSEKERAHIIDVLEKTAKDMGIWCDKPAGKIIEDRISQMGSKRRLRTNTRGQRNSKMCVRYIATKLPNSCQDLR